MMQRLRRHARPLFLAGAILAGTAFAATPVRAVEDCNQYDNPFEKTICFVSFEMDLISRWFDSHCS